MNFKNNIQLPKNVKIVEVSPRDGLQNEKEIIPTEKKIEFINLLSETGLQAIEVTSFVSKKRIPQLSDAKEVFQGIKKKSNIDYSALTPNLMGLENAIEAGVTSIAVITAASETFSEKNTHCSLKESLQRIEEIQNFIMLNNLNINMRGYISCVLGCPYEGRISPNKVAEMAKELITLGCYEISLGDTIGVGTPLKAQQLIEIVSKDISHSQLAIHFHDTYGQALANIYACLQMGIATIDSSVAGLGGCPYAKGASGNVATEDVLYMLKGMGIETGVDLDKIIHVSQFISKIVGHPNRSKVTQANSDQSNSGAF